VKWEKTRRSFVDYPDDGFWIRCNFLGMRMPDIYIWRKAPFMRIFIALVTGILIQWHLQLTPITLFSVLFACLVASVLFFYIPPVSRYRLGYFNGALLLICFSAFGALLTWRNDIRNRDSWFGHHYDSSAALVVTLEEKPVEKIRSFKANASVFELVENGRCVHVAGRIILYFQKDSVLPALSYGSQLVIRKELQEIKNSGNPGGFDYKQYCLFQKITHQVFLKQGDYVVLPTEHRKWLTSFLVGIRERVLHVLRTHIGSLKELGLAEALLIGYKDDLDKTLIQSYSNTGVVHIIAISGLHLGLIYWLLVQLLKPFQNKRCINWIGPVIIISGLWLFSLLAGAQPSILRSAVMFTCIVIGQSIGRKSSIYNSLAFSAFALLCWNPYWLWDVGFQLSYSAVLSIVIFMRPIYNLIYVKNKILDFFWKINAVTIAAQILTLPLSIYHFHQFPVYFLLTNFVAVPLSSVILFGEIFLCAISFIPAVAKLTGQLISLFIRLMNTYVERIEALPFSVWSSLQINIWQAIFLFLFVSGTGYWLLEKKKHGFQLALFALLCFVTVRSYSFEKASKQQEIIVYNIPHYRAIDFINGRGFWCMGDSDLVHNDFVQNFHIKPSRILQRVGTMQPRNNLSAAENWICFGNKKILLIDRTISFDLPFTRQAIDLVVVSKNPKLSLTRLYNWLDVKLIVFDASVPAVKLKYWKKDCDSLHIPYYDVSEKGAFVMTLN
jgi:competence protein ComEC